jgi:hypothetical protein
MRPARFAARWHGAWVETGIELDGSSTLPVEFGRQLRSPKAEGRKKAEIRNPKLSFSDPGARRFQKPPSEPDCQATAFRGAPLIEARRAS